MALPVSSDAPILPICQYDPHNPPCYPNVGQLPKEVEHLVANMASAIANIAGQKAHANPARMFMYNLLSVNYWNDQYFATVVNLALATLCLEYRKGKYRAPEPAVQEVADKVLTLESSNIIFEYPDLKSICRPQIVDAAFQNISTLNSLKQEVSQMYHTQGNVHMGVNAHAPMGSNAPMHQPQGQVVMTPNGPMMMVPVPQQGAMPPMYQQQQQQHFRQPMPSGNTWNNQPKNIFSGDNEHSVDGATLSQGRFFTRSAKQQMQHQQQEEPVKMEPIVEQVKDYLEIEGGSEMDRMKHQIHYFGQAYSADNVIKTRNYQAMSNSLAQSTMGEATSEYHLDPNVDVTISLASAIQNARMKQLEVQEGNDAYRSFAFVADPIFCSKEVKEFIHEFKSSNELHVLAKKMLSLVKAVEINEDLNYRDAIIGFMCNLDKQLTEIVNNYLRNNLRLNLSIDSFIEDISGLPSYLLEKYGNNYMHDFKRFDDELIDIMLANIDESELKEIDEVIAAPDNVHYGFILKSYSFTMLNVSRLDLGFKFNADKFGLSDIIDKETAPTLYQLAESLAKHKKDLQMLTSYDLFITTDNVVYQICRNVVNGNNQFNIAKM